MQIISFKTKSVANDSKILHNFLYKVDVLKIQCQRLKKKEQKDASNLINFCIEYCKKFCYELVTVIT